MLLRACENSNTSPGVKLLGVGLSLLLLAGCASSGERRATLAVVGKAAGGEYWGAVRNGAQKRAAELDVKLIYLGPRSETDTAAQIRYVEALIQRDVDGIAISPVDAEALSPIVKKAVAAGVKVVTIDSDTAAKDRLSYVGPDNEAAGELAGKEMLKLVPNGKVAVVTGVLGATNLMERQEGFKKAVGGKLELLKPQPVAGDKSKSLAIAENTLRANKDVVAFFTDNAFAAPGVAQALQASGKGSRVKVVSFDVTPALTKHLQGGNVQVLIAQQPEKIGAVGVDSLVKAIRGEKIPPRIDTGVVVVTKDNLARYDSQK